VGVVDIGSNTVRLVVYETPTRVPIPIFNEKSQCALGAGMGKTGRLNPQGITKALQALVRFVYLARAMGVDRMQMVATAAVRDALDGPVFVARIERTCGVPVHVLSGAEEARLAAVGVLNGLPGADGVVGDLGGGSLDLVGLDVGKVGPFATLSLGHLRLAEDCGGDRIQARRILARSLAGVPWLAAMRERTVYAVGGSWRALARIFIEQTHYPLHVVDNYTIPFADALRLSDLIGGLSINSLEKMAATAGRRVDTLPFASLALSALLEAARPARVVFSASSMREGQMLELLPLPLRHQDPLISACQTHAERTDRFAVHGDELLAWTTPLFTGETEPERRLRLALCLLSEIGWSEHPDYRAVHAFHRVLRIPYPGLTHPDRAEMALAVLMRYGGDEDDRMVAPIRTLLDDRRLARARIAGLALRLAHTLSGGAPGLLALTRLQVEAGKLVLHLTENSSLFLSEAVERRFRALARSMALKPVIPGAMEAA
jgi:exopolyphosphatase/guanosine-5'-triphosphate,3'-diphosphate pyrophosphatase